MGVVQTPVKLVNVIVGDLPTHETGDFYLTVETGSNPPQITAVVENAEPKFVKFPDEMLIKIRDSSLESNVRFCLKKLNALGSQELCEAYVSPKMLLFWMEQAQEPDEDLVGWIDWASRRKLRYVGQLVSLLMLVSFSFLFSRYYCLSCYEKYETITLLKMADAEFPVKPAIAREFKYQCGLSMNLVQRIMDEDVMHLPGVGEPKVDAKKCEVTYEEVKAICNELPVGALEPTIPVEIPLAGWKFGLPCFPPLCILHHHLHDAGMYHTIFVVVMCIIIFSVWLAFTLSIMKLERDLISRNKRALAKEGGE